MEYQLVVAERHNGYWAYYYPANQRPVWNFDRPFVYGKSVAVVLTKAKLIKPDDGPVVFTYIDRSES
jgi:hypothetical protein